MGLTNTKNIKIEHSDTAIRGFFDEYRWLSNFYECPVRTLDIIYGSAEAAYQSCKTSDKEIKLLMSKMGPLESKRYAKNNIVLPENWNKTKSLFMSVIVISKFMLNEDLKKKLMDTGTKYLEETNWWGDTYWGVCDGVGENVLGKILMKVRDELFLFA